jgi:hypothetical protein
MTIHQIDQNAATHAGSSTATRAAKESSKRNDSQVRHARELVSLFDRHRELRGVSAMADFFDDAVRWTA